jgi:hypothetical protein
MQKDSRSVFRGRGRSDLTAYGNNRLGDHPHAVVVVAGMAAHPQVGLVDRERVLVGGDSLGLFR